jgi:hypothetical protein
MKCQLCSTDAPAETDPESGRLRCSQCKAFWGSGSSQSSAVRQARDILQRWSSTDLLDEISSFPTVPPLPDPTKPNPVAKSSQETPQKAPDRGDQDDSSRSRENSKILSLAEAMKKQTTVVSSADEGDSSASESLNNDEVPDSADAAPAESTPQLAIVRPDSPPARHVEKSVYKPDETIVAGQTPAAAEETAKKPTRRRLTRAPVNRRLKTPQNDDIAKPKLSITEPEATQQGMDVVNRKYRVDRPGSHAPLSDPAATPGEVETADPRAQDATSSRRFRIDGATSVNELAGGGGRVRGQGKSRQRYIDEAHESQVLRGPHFEMNPPRRSSLTSLTGQFLAYTGVLGLTVGTAIVIYGHFGGMSEYTPTGWLVTTVAQMLLFLGVINLVSGGIEQNNHDVSHRINVLGEQLMRIEQVTETAMRGPKISPERYAGTATESSHRERETVTVEDQR